ncbi:MAG: ABC transporter substrate-binding protein [Dehalococcoidia bacterium]
MSKRHRLGPISRRSALRAGVTVAGGATAAWLVACAGGGAGQQGGSASGATTRTGDAGTPKSGGTLVWGMESDIDPIDPHTVNAWVTWRVNYQMFETLVAKDLTVDTKGATQPDVPRLAESYETTDGAAYVFKLRKNVKFHDDTEFNAEAVKANFERWIDKSNPNFNVRAQRRQQYLIQHLDKIETPDSHTIIFKNKRAYGEFIPLQTGYFFPAMLSPTALKKWGNDDIAKHPTGTGPFKFVERVEGQRIVIERNPNYWGSKAYLDKIVFRPIPEPVARVTALQTGEASLIFVPPPDNLDQLRSAGFKTLQGPTPHIWYMNMNLLNPAMRDVRVRKAFQLAIDKEGMAKNLLRDTVTPAHQMHAPGAPAHDPTFKMYKYDPAEAKKLLAAAGFPNGFKTQWWFAAAGSGNILPVAMAEWIQRDLAKVGVQMEITSQEWIAYLGALNDLLKLENMASYQMSWGMSTNFWLNVIGHGKWRTTEFPGTWFWKYDEANTERLNAVFDKAEVTADREESNKLYREANQLIMDTAWYLPIVHDSAPIVMQSKVNGLVHATEEAYDARPVWLS